MDKRLERQKRGNRRPTISQVALRAGVSPAVVSLVMNGRAQAGRISTATETKVRKTAQAMHYQPSMAARQLAGQRSNAIGVLINTGAQADARLIALMESHAATKGLRFIVGHAVGSLAQAREYLDDFENRGVDGVISIFHNHPDYCKEVLKRLQRFRHVVYYERPAAEFSAHHATCFIQPDYYEACRLGVSHLVARGRRRIALVLKDLIFDYSRAWRQAYSDVLKESGLNEDAKLVWVMDEQPSLSWKDEFSVELSHDLAQSLAVERGADAIIANSDFFAARINVALRHLGVRVPEDVALVGCDDQPFCTLVAPALTSIDLHIERLAHEAVDMLLVQLGTGAFPHPAENIITPHLIHRESS